MPYQKIPKALRPLYLKGLPNSRLLKQANHLDLISNFQDSTYKLPDSVRKLQVVFKNHGSFGHIGMRKFWKNNLKTIAFHNPELAIEVSRIECTTPEEQHQCPAAVKVHYANGKIETIDGKDKHSSDIMSQLVELTQAEKIPEDQIQLFVSKLAK